MAAAMNSNFIERSITGALAFIKESVFSDEYASRRGFLQSIDPRIKLVTFAFFLLSILFTNSIAVSALLYAVCLILTYASGIQLSFFLKRTWIFIPLFSVCIAMPALFSAFTPGQALVSFDLFGAHLVITRQGLAGASLFVMRVVASVSFAVLLSITTRHFELLKILRIFRVPQVFVMILGMCYRYIYLFVDVIQNTFLAIKSRVGSEVEPKRGQHVVAWNMASLWYRSYRLNEEVYNAMLSRGYSGEPVIFNDFKSRSRDWAWLSVSLLLCASALYLGAKVKV